MDFQPILNEIVKSVIVASIGLLGPILVGAAVQMLRKYNVELSDAQQAQLRSSVQNILVEVEEWAAHRIKADLTVTSGMKMERAVERIAKIAPQLSEEDASKLVREELPKVGLGAINYLNQASEASEPKK